MEKLIKIIVSVFVLSFIISGRLSFSESFAAKQNSCNFFALKNQAYENQPVIDCNYHTYREIVLNKSREYGLDWRLIMAIIHQESKFDKNAISEKGAQGLMQLMPTTQMDIDENLENSFNPHKNIETGINYFSQLYSLFNSSKEEDRIDLALAAYNAGPNRIYDAQNIAAYLGEDPYSWRAIQNALPLLSKRYHTLHQSIWDGGKPRNGYFGSWRQTIFYVNSIIKYRNQLDNYSDFHI
jgi:membrane-bound lytic murein transglycosylase MltF